MGKSALRKGMLKGKLLPNSLLFAKIYQRSHFSNFLKLLQRYTIFMILESIHVSRHIRMVYYNGCCYSHVKLDFAAIKCRGKFIVYKPWGYKVNGSETRVRVPIYFAWDWFLCAGEKDLPRTEQESMKLEPNGKQ